MSLGNYGPHGAEEEHEAFWTDVAGADLPPEPGNALESLSGLDVQEPYSPAIAHGMSTEGDKIIPEPIARKLEESQNAEQELDDLAELPDEDLDEMPGDDTDDL